MALTLAPQAWFTALDDSGVTIPGALIYTYAAGTSTPLATYTDVNGSVANANPVVCDAAGRCVMFLSPLSYKFVYKTAADVTIRTQDNIAAVPGTTINTDIAGTAGEALTAGDLAYLSDGSGSLTAGRWYKADSDLVYGSISAPALGFVVDNIASGDSGSIRTGGRITGLAGLTAGTLYYASSTAGALSSTASGNARLIGAADSTTSLVIFPVPPVTPYSLNAAITAGEALTANDLVYMSDGSGALTAGRWYKADADNIYSGVMAPQLGIVRSAVSSAAVGVVQTGGLVTGLSGLTAGTVYYVSGTAGALTATVTTMPRRVGVAASTTSLMLDPAPFGMHLHGPYVTSQASSGTTETSTIATPPTVPASTLANNGDWMRATYMGINDATNNQITIRTKLGGTTMATFQFTPNAAAAVWKLVVEVHRTTAANAQNVLSSLLYSEAAGATQSPFVAVTQGTKDLATALTFDVTIQKATAGTITFYSAFFEFGTASMT